MPGLPPMIPPPPAAVIRDWPHSFKTRKYRRIERLFVEQDGLCWICGEPMLLPRIDRGTNRITATLDHLMPKPPAPRPENLCRPVKAAHRYCNSARGHKMPAEPKEVAFIRKLFANPAWRLSAYEQQRTDLEKFLLQGQAPSPHPETVIRGQPTIVAGAALLTGGRGGPLSQPDVCDASAAQPSSYTAGEP